MMTKQMQFMCGYFEKMDQSPHVILISTCHCPPGTVALLRDGLDALSAKK